ncbi:hypothetical protein [Mucilaginibacter sp.]|uniref:hypothetical protein n=1 Tax=Mucilaginibacter sp. TaxID=1882438 RepID=UPI00284DB230|nr:hypothetical protein [Mucilaginibacter sp.]MDR3697567.1 hypothetical protein [Mucilaginibacter sp.]
MIFNALSASVQEGFAQGTLTNYIYEENLFSVHYGDEPLSINFFDFAPVFNNEFDADLRGLTKSYWHGYARQLQNLFIVKTNTWAYEKEWRAIQVNFEGPKEPEERVRHYPIEVLTGIYFGYNTPEIAKKRIAAIYWEKHHEINFISCKLSNARELTYEPWELEEE